MQFIFELNILESITLESIVHCKVILTKYSFMYFTKRRLQLGKHLTINPLFKTVSLT